MRTSKISIMKKKKRFVTLNKKSNGIHQSIYRALNIMTQAAAILLLAQIVSNNSSLTVIVV